MNTNSVCDIRRIEDANWIDIPAQGGKLFANLGQIELHADSRYLLTVNADGSPNIKEIPMYAAIATQDRYLEMMLEPNGTYVSTEVLQAFVTAATEELDRRLAFAGRASA